MQLQTSPPATASPPAEQMQPTEKQPTAEPILIIPGYGYCLPVKPQSATDVCMLGMELDLTRTSLCARGHSFDGKGLSWVALDVFVK